MDEYHEPLRDKKIKFKTNQVNHYLGIDIPVNQVKRILTSLGFGVRGDRDLIVEVPWWRHHDVDQGHDIIEEVARIYGYHNLPSVTPQGNIPIVEQDPILQREAEIKKLLQGSGFTELYSYAMISARHFEKANLSAKDALELSNPLSEDMVYMRTSLIPQLLEVIGANCNAFSRQRVFELARVYLPVSEQDLPKEMPRLCGAVVGEEDVFFQGKGVVEQLLESLGIHECRFDPFTSHLFSQLLNIFKDNRSLGRVGMIKAEITKNFGIDTPVVVFDLDVNALTESAQSDKVYRPVPQYPSVARDFSIVVEKSVLWQTVKFLVSQIDPLIVDVEYLDTYTGQSLPEGKKSLSFRVVFRSTEKTLTSEEADRISEAIINGLKQKFELSVR